MTRSYSNVEIKDVRKTILEWDDYLRTMPPDDNYVTNRESKGFKLWNTINDFLYAWDFFMRGEADERDQQISHEIAMYLACDNKIDEKINLPYLRNMLIESGILVDGISQKEAGRFADRYFGLSQGTSEREYQKYKKKSDSDLKKEKNREIKKTTQRTFRNLIMSKEAILDMNS